MGAFPTAEHDVKSWFPWQPNIANDFELSMDSKHKVVDETIRHEV